MQRSNTDMVIAGAGVALIVGFFLPWIDLGHVSARASGYAITTTEGVPGGLWKMMMWLAPIGGAAMLALAMTGRTRAARLTAMGTGALLMLYGVAKMVELFFNVTGLGLWMVFAAAVTAFVAPLLAKRSTT